MRRTPLLALLLLSPACGLEFGGDEAALSDPDLPPAPPEPWVAIFNPVDVPAAETAAYLPGASDVTANGAYTYALPLVVPPGRAGMQPELALSYSSASIANGALGVGWSVAGLSTITRCGSSLAVDGFTDGVDFGDYGTDATPDKLCLDGQRLALVAGTYGLGGSEYRTQRTTFAKITALGDDPWGPTSFEVRLANGRIRTYTALARDRFHIGPSGGLDYDGKTRALWVLAKEEDRSGNAMEYVYSERSSPQQALGGTQQVTLDEIRYTSHPDQPAQRAVTFHYEDVRPDKELAWAHGMKSGLFLRLASIVMHAPNPTAKGPVWTYRLGYETSTSSGRSLLASIERCAMVAGSPTGCTYAKQFTWTQAAKKPAFTVVDHGDFPLTFDVPGLRKYDMQVLDANGDGTDDVLLGQRDPYAGEPGDEDGVVTDVKLRLGARTNPLATAHDVLAGGAYPLTTRLGASRPIDMDSDGKTDLWAVYGTDTRGPMSDWCAARLLKWNPPTNTFVATMITDAEHVCGDSKQTFLDWNGDGRIDRLSALDTYTNDEDSDLVPGKWKLALNTGGTAFTAFASSGLSSGCRARVTDVDGDGRGELVTAKAPPNGTGCTVPTLLSSVDQTHALQQTTVLPGEFIGHRYQIDPRAELADFNGDGLEDALLLDHPSANGPQISGTIQWSTGAGFTDPQPTNLALQNHFGGYPTSVFNRADGGVQVGDFNRDGRADLLVLTYSPDPVAPFVGGFAGHRLSALIAFSNGDGTFTQLGGLSLPYGTYAGDFNLVRTGDFNGDGYLDVAMVAEYSTTDHRFVVALQQPAVVDRIKAVRDEKAGWDRETIGYSTEWSNAPEAPAGTCAYPVRCIGRRGTTLVRSVVTRDHLVDPTNANLGRTRHYSYEDPVGDVHGGFIGFRKTRVWDSSIPAETVTIYDPRTAVTSPIAPGHRVRASAARPVSVTVTTPILKQGQLLPLAGAWPARVARTLHTHKVRWLDSNKTHTIETTATTDLAWEQSVSVNQLGFSAERLTGIVQPAAPPIRVDTTAGYDGYGNPTYLHRVTAGGTKSYEAFTYEYRTAAWLVNLLRKHTETRHEADGVPAGTTRTTEYSYDAVGRLATTTRNGSTPDLGARSMTTLTRDAYGSITRAVETGYALGAPAKAREVRLEYAPTFTGQPDERIFPSQIWSPFDVPEYRPSRWLATYPATGVVYAQMDANGVAGGFKHDWLGRPTYISREGAAPLVVSYAGRPDTYAAGVINGLVETRTSAGRTTKTATGLTGQVVRTSVTGFGGGLVHVDTTYDALGRRVKESRPHASTASLFHTYTYDSLGRLVEERTPDAKVLTYVHSLFETHAFDADNRESIRRVDVDGRLVYTANLVDGVEVGTTFEWGPFDLLAAVIDDQGNAVRMTYDLRGRQIRREDPDQGITTALYNGLDELRSTTHLGTGKVTAFEYDALGRKTSMTNADGETRFTYDTATNGIGLVARAESPDGIVSDLAYDTAGRMVRRTDTIDGVAYAVDKPFDALGRVAHVDYPGGVRVTPSYNASSDVVNVGYTAGSTGGTLLTVTARNLDQRLTLGTLGNGVMLRHDYFPETGRVRNLLATLPGQPALLDLAYGYHNSGLVSSRRDAVHGRTERFAYDGARRLTQWALNTPSASRTTVYGYDTIGNLEHVWIDGALHETYTFGNADGTQPHTLETLTVGATTVAYEHDAEGRQVEAPGRVVEYRDHDLPRSVTRAGKTWTYKYDAFGKRAVQAGPDGTTIYVGGVYERRVLPGSVQDVYLVDGPDGRLAQLVRTGGELAVQYILGDVLDSTNAVVNSAGALVASGFYEPFGQRTNVQGLPLSASTGDVRDGFTGHEHDPTGLVNMNGRMYDPLAKRFLSADPYVSAPAFGQAWNPYSYVGNSPLNVVDPTGYRWSGEWGCLGTPGGCLEGGAGGDGGGGGGGGSTETSQGSIAAFNSFLIGSLNRMGGDGGARSDGASYGGRTVTPRVEEPPPTTIYTREGTTDYDVFEVGHDDDGHSRWIRPPASLLRVDPTLVWRLYQLMLDRVAFGRDAYRTGLPVTDELARRYPYLFRLNDEGRKALNWINPLGSLHWDKMGTMRGLWGETDTAYEFQDLAVRDAMDYAADETLQLMEPFMDEPGVAEAVQEFKATYKTAPPRELWDLSYRQPSFERWSQEREQERVLEALRDMM